MCVVMYSLSVALFTVYSISENLAQSALGNLSFLAKRYAYDFTVLTWCLVWLVEGNILASRLQMEERLTSERRPYVAMNYINVVI